MNNTDKIYDLNPNAEKSAFATSITATGENNSVGLALQSAPIFRLTDKRAKEILEEVTKAVANWYKTARRLKLSERAVERMRGAFKV